MFAGAYRLLGELALHDLQALGDFFFVGGSAVTPQQELRDVGGDGILPLEAAHQVFTDDISLEGLGREGVDGIKGVAHGSVSEGG